MHALRSCIVDINELRWFQSVADGVTLTEVADLYMVSQPGVSRALHRLEVEVGAPLLAKSGRVLRPTQAGAAFKRHVDAVLHQLDDGLAAVDELVEPESGTVRLGFEPSFGAWLVPRLVSGFRREHPHVRFELVPSDDATEASLLLDATVDLHITATRADSASARWRRLFAQPFLLAVPPGHRLAGRTEVGLAEVAEDEFVMLRPSWALRRITDELCRAAGYSPRVAFEGHDLVVVRGLVAAGLGVALVPSSSFAPSPSSPDGEQLLRVTDRAAYRDVGLATSRTRRLLPSAELFETYAMTHSPSELVPPAAGSLPPR